MRKCQCGCKKPATGGNGVTAWASVECALKIAQKRREKLERREINAKREKLKTRRDWMNEAQTAINAFRRAEDESKGYPCISCGRHHKGQYHAGHYLSRGANPELSLDPKNIHLQCQPCNTHLSGNQINYRKGLIARYGVELVEWLEGPHEPKHHTIDDLKQIRDHYRAKLKELKRNHHG